MALLQSSLASVVFPHPVPSGPVVPAISRQPLLPGLENTVFRNSSPSVSSSSKPLDRENILNEQFIIIVL